MGVEMSSSMLILLVRVSSFGVMSVDGEFVLLLSRVIRLVM